MTIIREGIFTTGYLSLGPMFSEYFKTKHNVEKNKSKILGAVFGGIIAATLSHPMDTIKTCMQGDIERKNYTTLKDTTNKLIKENGWKRFYNGWSWRTSRMICAIFLMNECREFLDKINFKSGAF